MGRLIDEDIVIDIINFECGKWTGLSKTIEKEIKALPSAQPEKMQLSGESTTKDSTFDCISRQAAIDGKISIQRTNGVEMYSDEAVPVEYLKALSSAQTDEKRTEKRTETRACDLISRQVAIDTDGLDEEIRCEMCKNPTHTDRGCDGNCRYDEKLYKKIIQLLNKRITPLPPAQPDARYINANELIKRLQQAGLDDAVSIAVKMAGHERLKHVPSAQPSNGACWGCQCEKVEKLQPERKKGKWIPISDGYVDIYECNQCGDTEDYERNFCPNCGAKMMRGEQNEIDRC